MNQITMQRRARLLAGFAPQAAAAAKPAALDITEIRHFPDPRTGFGKSLFAAAGNDPIGTHGLG